MIIVSVCVCVGECVGVCVCGCFGVCVGVCVLNLEIGTMEKKLKSLIAT